MSAPDSLWARLAMQLMIALIAGTLLAGCAQAAVNGVYFMETPRPAYLADDFNDAAEWRWEFGAAPDYPHDHEFRSGYYIANGHRQIIASNEPYPAEGTVEIDWEIWPSGSSPTLSNFDEFDFRVVLDTSLTQGQEPSGPLVELKLADDESVPPQDRLRLAEGPAPEAESSRESADSAFPRSGMLRATFNRTSAVPFISAELHDGSGAIVLEHILEVPEGWDEEAQIVIYVSGLRDDGPRTIDSIYAFPPGDAP